MEFEDDARMKFEYDSSEPTLETIEDLFDDILAEAKKGEGTADRPSFAGKMNKLETAMQTIGYFIEANKLEQPYVAWGKTRAAALRGREEIRPAESEEVRQANARYKELRRDIAETYDEIDAMYVEVLDKYFPRRRSRNA